MSTAAHMERIAIRAEVVRIVETWGSERGVDVRQLLFRLRTAPLPPRTDQPTGGGGE